MKPEETRKLLSSFIHYFENNYTLSSVGQDKLKLNATTFTARQFVNKFKKEVKAIQDEIGLLEYSTMVDHIQKKRKLDMDSAVEALAEKVFEVKCLDLSKKKKKSVTVASESKIIDHRFNWSGHIPLLDVKTTQAVMFNDVEKKVNHRVSYKSWEKWVKCQHSDDRKYLLQSVTPCVVYYDPYKVEDVYYQDFAGQKDILHVNAHNMPEWRKEEIEDPILPKMFKELMTHLFPKKTCQEYVIHWIYYALTNRNQTYLFLHGDQGIGKNTLAAVIERLVGSDNYNSVGPEFFEDRFNDPLRYKRVVLFDECVITSDNLSTIKYMTNSKLSIQGKGEDPVTLENHCSYMIFNNLDRINRVTADDRRYSVPILTDTAIGNKYGQEWLDEFYYKLDNDEKFISQIGWWILKKGFTNKFTPTKPYLTSFFYDIVEKGMTEWQRKVISLIEGREYKEIDLEDLDAILGLSVGRVKIKTFLDSHRDREGDQMAELIQRKSKRFIVPKEKYAPEVQEEEELGDVGTMEF